MDTKQVKQQEKSELKQAKLISKYSTDYDMTLVAKLTFYSFIGFSAALVIMEGISMVFFRPQDGTVRFLTPEIIHSLFGYMGGWAQAIVTFLFGKKLADRFNDKINGNGGSHAKTPPGADH